MGKLATAVGDPRAGAVRRGLRGRAGGFGGRRGRARRFPGRDCRGGLVRSPSAGAAVGLGPRRRGAGRRHDQARERCARPARPDRRARELRRVLRGRGRSGALAASPCRRARPARARPGARRRRPLRPPPPLRVQGPDERQPRARPPRRGQRLVLRRRPRPLRAPAPRERAHREGASARRVGRLPRPPRPPAAFETHPKQAPAPQAAVGGDCHPSYAGACLDPSASDYDCAGGSGDGPAYTDRVRVVGDDEYDLDPDGDGVACETSR